MTFIEPMRMQNIMMLWLRLLAVTLLFAAAQTTRAADDFLDPETAFTAGNQQGQEFGQLPATRSLGFQVSVTP